MNRVLVICDDMWHPAEVIEKGFALLEGGAYAFDFVKAAKDILTEERIAAYPIVISCKGNNIIAANSEPWFEDGVTEVGPEQLRAYVEQGGNFIAIHSANSFTEAHCKKEEKFQKLCREYIELVGNRFVGHPPRCTVNVHVTDKSHPIMKGIEDFQIRDEHYEIIDIAADASLLFETVSEHGGTQAGGYVRHIGAGTVCVLTPGHTLSVWEHSVFRQIVINTMDWCLSR